MSETGPAPAQPPASGQPQGPEAPDYRDLFLRATAELDNYRKRNERERQALIQYAAEALAKRLLDPADSFERAIRDLDRVLAQAPEVLIAPLGASLEGLRALRRQFMDALASEGVEPFRPDGRPFDPAFHEALVRLPHPTSPEGTVLEVLQAGYTLRGRVLRPARVAVSSGPPADVAAEATANGATENHSHVSHSGRKPGGSDRSE